MRCSVRLCACRSSCSVSPRILQISSPTYCSRTMTHTPFHMVSLSVLKLLQLNENWLVGSPSIPPLFSHPIPQSEHVACMSNCMPRLDCTRLKLLHCSMVVGKKDGQFDVLNGEAIAANRRMLKRCCRAAHAGCAEKRSSNP
jgi:hypothetical protein